MMPLAPRNVAFVSVLAVAGCSAAGERHEWSLLQVVEHAHRATTDPARTVVVLRDGYCIVGVRAPHAPSRVWVLMNPRHAPFVKTVPKGAVRLSPAEVASLPVDCRPHPAVAKAIVG